MNAVTLIDEVTRGGFKLNINDGRLVIDAPTGAITDELRGMLRQHKAEIIAHLTGAPTGMTPTEETAFRCWCAFIGEHDEELIGDALERCRVDPVALAYFLARSLEVPQPIADDRRPCTSCHKFTAQGRCLAAARGEIDTTKRYEPSPAILRRCAAFMAIPELDAD